VIGFMLHIEVAAIDYMRGAACLDGGADHGFEQR
jgi:hypothetical protein